MFKKNSLTLRNARFVSAYADTLVSIVRVILEVHVFICYPVFRNRSLIMAQGGWRKIRDFFFGGGGASPKNLQQGGGSKKLFCLMRGVG